MRNVLGVSLSHRSAAEHSSLGLARFTVTPVITDTPDGKDADSWSANLRDCHLRLWSRPTPSGVVLKLASTARPPYRLVHSTPDGTVRWSSDAIVHTYAQQVSDEAFDAVGQDAVMQFFADACTIAGFIVFPADRVEGRMTINGARGLNHLVKDRFDLTLECIRRWYAGQPGPLADVFDRYTGFFDLFVDFTGYVRFFLLDDLVVADTSQVRFWLPFADFGERHPVPQTGDEYRAYMAAARAFLAARNTRMAPYLC